MPIDERPLMPEARAALRKQLNAWVADSIGRSRLSRSEVATRLNKTLSWLGNRVWGGGNVSLKTAEVEKLGRILRIAIPPEMAQAAQQLENAGIRRKSTRANLVPVDQAAVRQAGSAAAEMQLVLDAACNGRRDKARDYEWVRRRFGLGQEQAETLEEIGKDAGVTRERVRQIEAKVLKLAAECAAAMELPVLASIRQHVTESRGLPWETLATELKRSLGEVSLEEAIRFMQSVWPSKDMVGVERASIYGQGKTLRVITSQADDGKLTSAVSTAVRKLFNFAGAALVPDVRHLVELALKRPVTHRDLVRIMMSLPEIHWLDESRRWCWFETAALSSLLRRTAVIITAAGNAVPMETIYAGLVREARRDFSSIASEITDPVPPCHVVHAILVRHRAFHRGPANAFTFLGEVDLEAELGQGRASVLRRLNELGGAATREDLASMEQHPTAPVASGLLSVILYSAGFVERLGPATWGVRGRLIDEDRRHAVLLEGARSSPRHAGRMRQDGPTWQVVVRPSAAARLYRRIEIPANEAPDGVGGLYRLPDGHELMLVQDKAGTRVTQQGRLLHEMLATPSLEAIRFEFDSVARTVQVEPAD
jgi:hypothetical protein